jgi:mRNA interferase MazF
VTRGDLTTVVISGEYGKPRPALIIQDNRFADVPSITVLLLTSQLTDAPLLRISVEANDTTGLERPSHVMIDKTMTLSRGKLGQRMGRVDNDTMTRVSRALSVLLGLA